MGDRHVKVRVAEGEGFEPSKELVTPYSLSRRALSASQSSLRVAGRVYATGSGIGTGGVLSGDGSGGGPRTHRDPARAGAGRSLQGGGVPPRRRGRPRPVDRPPPRARGPGASRRPARDRVEHGPGRRPGPRRRGPRVPGPPRGRGRARRRPRRADPRRAARRPPPALRLVRRRRDRRADGAQGRRARAPVPRAHRPFAVVDGGARPRPGAARVATRAGRAPQRGAGPLPHPQGDRGRHPRRRFAWTRTKTCSPSSTSSWPACTRSCACPSSR